MSRDLPPGEYEVGPPIGNPEDALDEARIYYLPTFGYLPLEAQRYPTQEELNENVIIRAEFFPNGEVL